jgi:hypothetical protein
MDKEFQTSFIPKKPLAEVRTPAPKPVNIFSFIAMILFFASLISAGGVYFYKVLLTKRIADMGVQLARAKDAFEPSLISDLETLDKRINSSKEILSNHILVSPIFKALEEMTLRSIRFSKFSYTYNAGDKAVGVKISGQAKDYNAIAAQSDILGENKYIKNPVFSNLNLDTKGNVSFDLFFTVDPSFVKYEDALSRGQEDGSAPGTETPSSGEVPAGSQ